MHVIILRNLLLLGRRQHRKDRQGQHGGSHIGPPIPAEEVEADVAVGVDVFVAGGGLEEVDGGGLARVVHGEGELFLGDRGGGGEVRVGSEVSE